VHRHKNVWLQPHTVGYLIREHGPLFEPWSVRHTGLMQLYLDTALSEGKLIYILQRQKSTREDVNMLMLNSLSLSSEPQESEVMHCFGWGVAGFLFLSELRIVLYYSLFMIYGKCLCYSFELLCWSLILQTQDRHFFFFKLTCY